MSCGDQNRATHPSEYAGPTIVLIQLAADREGFTSRLREASDSIQRLYSRWITTNDHGNDLAGWSEQDGVSAVAPEHNWADAQTVEAECLPVDTDHCWRCRVATVSRGDDVGLCEFCKTVLRDLTARSDGPSPGPYLWRQEWLNEWVTGSLLRNGDSFVVTCVAAAVVV